MTSPELVPGSSPGVDQPPPGRVKRGGYNQRRMGPAPFASFEDLVDDADASQEGKVPLIPMPEIREDVCAVPDGSLLSPDPGVTGAGSGGGNLQTPSTPRIDISRASSSSHHDSKDSSPERELFGDGYGEGGATLGSGFKEDGTADLRSSTEELNYHSETGTVQEREMLRRRQKHSANATVFKYELEAQSEKERKDSACSELGLMLSISGRTSRLSSVGSAASNTSRLSVTGSAVSGASRSASPHKMLLETSFCGSTHSVNHLSVGSGSRQDVLEQTLLARSLDPTAAVVGGGGVVLTRGRSLSADGRDGLMMNGRGGLGGGMLRGARTKQAAAAVDSVTAEVEERPRKLKDTEGKYMREVEGTFISLKDSIERDDKAGSKSETAACKGASARQDGKYMTEVEGTFISLKHSIEKEDRQGAKPPTLKETGKSSKLKENDGKYMTEVEGTFISLKHSMDKEEKQGTKHPPLKDCSKTVTKPRIDGKYLTEVEGTFISLKHSMDKEDNQSTKPLSLKEGSKCVTKARVEGKYLTEVEGTFISLKDSLDRDDMPTAKAPTLKVAGAKPIAEGKYLNDVEGTFISLKHSLDKEDNQSTKAVTAKRPPLKEASNAVSKPKADGKYLTEVEGTFISLKHSLDKEDQPIKKTPTLKEASMKPKNEGKYLTEVEGTFISLKHSIEKEDKTSTKTPPLKEASKSIAKPRSDGKYLTEVEGTFISLKHSLDKEEETPSAKAQPSKLHQPLVSPSTKAPPTKSTSSKPPLAKTTTSKPPLAKTTISNPPLAKAPPAKAPAVKAPPLREASKSITKPKVEGKYLMDVEGTFISLKDSLDREDTPSAKAPPLKQAARSAPRAKAVEGKYLTEVEGTFISLKHSLDKEEPSMKPSTNVPATRETSKPTMKTKATEGKYLMEVEGTFISLKHSFDKEDNHSSNAASSNNTYRTSKPKVEGIYLTEVEGTFISLKDSLDREESEAEIPTPKHSCRSVKSSSDTGDSSTSLLDEIGSVLEQRDKRRSDASPRSRESVRSSGSDGTVVSSKCDSGCSQERGHEKRRPSLKELGKSSKLTDEEAFIRETEGTLMLMSLKCDLGSSLDREERGVEIPITLNLSESGKSIKPVQSFSQLVQKDGSRVTKPPDTTVTARSVTGTPSASPKPARHAVLRKDEVGSRTPSPSSNSRKSSFTSLFKRTGGDANSGNAVLSPESPSISSSAKKKQGFSALVKEVGEGLIERGRARSKSRERPESTSVSPLTVSTEGKLKKDAKNKSVFSSLFKKKDRKKGTKEDEVTSPVEVSSPEPTLPPPLEAIGNVEFTFNADGPPGRLAEDMMLPSESVMLPTLSHLYENRKAVVMSISSQEEEKVVGFSSHKEQKVVGSDRIRADAADEEDRHSSESERDSEMECIGARAEDTNEGARDGEGEGEGEDDHERKGFIAHQDSVDEELPYVPTTLPQERSVVVPLVPAKQRALAEVRTCPVERPRSTTPINPSLLDEFVTAGPALTREHKMKISLPREDSVPSKKSPRRSQARSWFEFAEQGLQSPREYRKSSLTSSMTSPSPPPLPPRATPPAAPTSPPQQQMPPPPPPAAKVQNWINFEEIPEKRKPPKRIQTIPSRGNIEYPEASRGGDGGKGVTYVNPEDCKCECHESSSRQPPAASGGGRDRAAAGKSDEPPRCSHWATSGDRRPRLEVEDRNSCVSDSSCEYSNAYSVEPDDEYPTSLRVMKPFGMDLDVTSNRSSIVSQDEQPSPDNELPH